MSDASRGEFGDFLRSRREKLSPNAVGLSIARPRRTPGLRRQEVAELAGIGVDWYIRMEQGRAVTPSTTTISALAAALRLTKAEHAHLRALARTPDRRAFAPESVPDAVRRVVESLDQPAYIVGRRWDILAWNPAAAGIFGDFSRVPEADRNILVYMLTDPRARRLFGETWADEAQRVVAQFRRTHDFWAGDPAFLELLSRLRRESPDFARWWERHDIRNAGAGQKLLHLPRRRARPYVYATFQANDDPALRLVIYTPV